MKFLIQQKIQPDWWSKSFAGWVLGFSLSIGCASLVTAWALKHLDPALAPQLGMWVVPWLWLPFVFLAYFIPKGWQAIFIYALCNMLIYTIIWLVAGA